MKLWPVLILLPFATSVAGADIEPELGIWNPIQSTPVDIWMHCANPSDADCIAATQAPPSDAVRFAGLENTEVCHGSNYPNTPASHAIYAVYRAHDVVYSDDREAPPRVPWTKELGYDVLLDSEVPATIEFYVALDLSTEQSADDVAIVAPQIRVGATIRAGTQEAGTTASYDAGTLIARGLSEAVTLSPNVNHGQVEYMPVDGIEVYRYTFPLEYSSTTIPAASGFNIRFDTFMDNPICQPEGRDAGITPEYVRPFAAGEIAPRLQWNIMNPIRIESLHPQQIGDDIVIHGAIKSAWGRHDVIRTNVTITGPGPVQTIDPLAWQNEDDHGFEVGLKPIIAAWGWPHKQDGGANGYYKVELNVSNVAQTSSARAVSAFQLGGTEGGFTPYSCSVGQTTAATTPETQCASPPDTPPLTTPVPMWLGLLAITVAGLIRHKNK